MNAIDHASDEPMDAGWWLDEAMRCIDRNDATAAEAALQRSLNMAPDNAWVHFRLGTLAASSGRPLAALHHFTDAHALEPWAGEIRMNLGNAMLVLDRWRGAAATLAPLDGALPGWWASTRATALRRYAEGKARTRQLLRLRRLAHGQIDRWQMLELAELLAKLGRFGGAKALCTTLMLENREDFSPFAIEADVVTQIDGPDAGITYLQSLESSFAGDGAFEVLCAQRCYEAGRIDDALRHSAKAGSAMDLGTHGRYLAAAERWSELAALSSPWMLQTDDTRPFSLTIRAARGLGRLRMFGEAAGAGGATIPCSIVQFWSQDDVPEDVSCAIATWRDKNPEYRHQLFNERRAAAYITDHFNGAARAFELCRHPAMKADFFRICFITREGGFYVDADDVCVRPLNEMRDMIGAADFVASLSSDPVPYVHNWFLAGRPDNLILRAAIDDMVGAIERADACRHVVDIWHTTGPGLITRTVARWLAAEQTADQDALFLTAGQYRDFDKTVDEMAYKSTDAGNWRLS